MRRIWVLGLLVLAVSLPSAAQITVTPDTTANLTFSKDTGTSTGAGGVNVAVPSNTGVMGVKFDIVFPGDTFRFDSTSITAGALLTTGATGAETYVFIVDRDSENLLPEGKVTVIGVRMQSTYSNKGLSNATYVVLSNLKFQKKNNDTNTVFQDSIYITNFEFRDQNNITVASSKTRITLRLLLLLLRRGTDFNGDGSANGFDQLDFLKVLNGILALGSLTDYGSTIGDVSASYENRTSNGVIDSTDQLIFLRYLNGLEI